MKQIVLNSIEGVSIYPTIGIVIFFTFFVVMLFRLWKMDSGLSAKMGNLPLEDQRQEP